jgi:DNA-binding GntR family transcriptional regulator
MIKPNYLLQEKAYDTIKEMIKNGDLEPGKIYSLNQMAGQFDISRTPFRDAVLRLEQERYVDVLPSKGFQVHLMTREDIIETYQMREALEFYCLKHLIANQKTQDGRFFLHKLEKKVQAQAMIIDGDRNAEAFARKDYEFHRSMIQSLHNESMLAIYRNFMYRIFWLNVTSFKQPGRIDDTLTEHRRILQMIYDCDLEALATLLHEHLVVAEKINLRNIEAKNKG